MKKNIIITGGARGIGEAIVRTLAEEGHSIFLNYNKSETRYKKKRRRSGCIQSRHFRYKPRKGNV